MSLVVHPAFSWPVERINDGIEHFHYIAWNRILLEVEHALTEISPQNLRVHTNIYISMQKLSVQQAAQQAVEIDRLVRIEAMEVEKGKKDGQPRFACYSWLQTSINLWVRHNMVYAVLFSNCPGLWHDYDPTVTLPSEMELPAWMEEFGYDDRADRPGWIGESDWDLRGKVWNVISGTPQRHNQHRLVHTIFEGSAVYVAELWRRANVKPAREVA